RGSARAGTLHEVSRAARSAPKAASAWRPSDVLLDGFTILVTEGRAAAASELRQAASTFAQGEIAMAEGLRWGWLATFAAILLWDEETWHQLLVRQLQTVREAGLLAHLPLYLNALGVNLALRGDFASAASVIAEADAVAEATGTRIARYTAVLL